MPSMLACHGCKRILGHVDESLTALSDAAAVVEGRPEVHADAPSSVIAQLIYGSLP